VLYNTETTRGKMSQVRYDKLRKSKCKGGSIVREVIPKQSYRYKFEWQVYDDELKRTKKKTKTFSFGPKSGRTEEEALELAKAFQREMYPEHFP
jgi:hypothetical protein